MSILFLLLFDPSPAIDWPCQQLYDSRIAASETYYVTLTDEDTNSKVLHIVAEVGFVGMKLVLRKALETAHRQLAALHKLPLGRSILPSTRVSINLSFLLY